jgi:hypothetical protein
MHITRSGGAKVWVVQDAGDRVSRLSLS